MASKTTHVTTSAMPKKASAEGEKSRLLTTAPVRLGRNVSGQSRKGLGKPY